LRQKTGLAYNLCREALNRHDNDVAQAEAWLISQAIVHGHQRATKVKDRSAKEGLFCLATSSADRQATLVEINCETDFVAKNELFKDFAIGITREISSMPLDSHQNEDTSRSIQELALRSDQLARLDDKVVPMITKLGENIKISRALHLITPDALDDVTLHGRIHAKSAEKSLDEFNIAIGRFAAALALKSPKAKLPESRQSLRNIGDRLCQHIIGYNPQYIELPEDVRKNLLKLERERELNQTKIESADEEEEFSDGEGSLEQSGSSRDDWPSIMDQTLIMSDDQPVRDYCQSNDVKIIQFWRFEQ